MVTDFPVPFWRELKEGAVPYADERGNRGTCTPASRMSRYSDSDPYLDPETGVLKNRLAITDEVTLEKAEAALNGNFDLPHLQALHRHLFGDVYEWVGELRDGK